jgi:group I intron endonuclease
MTSKLQEQCDRRLVSGVYTITCNTTGDTYVGSSRNVYKRWAGHKYKLNRNIGAKKLQCAWDKYGSSDFTFRFVEVVADIDRLIAIEQSWLWRTNPAFNTAPAAAHGGGGLAGTKLEDEHKRKITEGLNRYYSKNSPTPEAIAKTSAALRGKKKSAGHVAKIKARALRSWEDPDFRRRVTMNQPTALSESQVLDIRRLHAAGMPQNKIAQMFNRSRASVCLVVNRKSYTHI